MASYFKDKGKHLSLMSDSPNTTLSLKHLVCGELFFLPLSTTVRQVEITKANVCEQKDRELSHKINTLIKRYWK